MRRNIAICTCLLGLLTCALVPALAKDSDKVKNKGVITLRNGDTLTVKSSDGDYTVTINSDTKIEHPVGLSGVRKKQDSPDVLIPGLKMKFEGTSRAQENQVTASRIEFDSDDLALAQVIQAGLNPTAMQQARNTQAISSNTSAIDANAAAIASAKEDIALTQVEIEANRAGLDEVAKATAKRFSEMGEVVTKDEFAVYFATGDYSLSKEAKEKLTSIARQGLNYSKGWAISVSGFADSTGTAAANQTLSKQRAQAVVAYLLQDCGIPVGRILAPGAMGEANPVASNENASGRSENRRVDVKLLLNKGVAGGM